MDQPEKMDSCTIASKPPNVDNEADKLIFVNHQLLNARDRLIDSLGAKSSRFYFDYLKLWFYKIWTKDEFHKKCRALLSPQQYDLHNEFSLDILKMMNVLSEIEVRFQSAAAAPATIVPSSSKNGAKR